MRNRQRLMMEVLAFLLTVITMVLGGLMYFSNLKNTRQNLIGVELADFIYNTNYSMQFGKKIETFYGMQDNLLSLRNSIDDVERLYIISEKNTPLFSTDQETLPERVSSMPAGNNLSDGDYLYCMYAINDNARILTVSSIAAMGQDLKSYLLKLAGIAAAGFVLVWILIRLAWKLVSDQNKAYRLAAALAVLWIVLFSAMTGVDEYREYAGSTRTLQDHIGESVRTDLQKLEGLGVERKNFYEIEEYLKRYTDLIPEVEELTLEEDDEIACRMSVDYRRKKYLDYVLQTVLLLTFSILILAEYQFFITNTGRLAEEEQNGTD